MSEEALPWTPSQVEAVLRRGGPLLVAMSGGVDSSVVALLAHRALPGNAVAVTLTGPAVSDAEVDRARRVAASIGIRHIRLPVNPLADANYRANPANRCYFCRRTETAALTSWGRANGVHRYVDGVHLDDLTDDRPGLRAMAEAGFVHPLVDARWRKATIRQFARDEGLPNWDQPSDACLASRIPHGRELSLLLLDRVRLAERGLLDRGFRRVRVRTEGGGARVVVAASEVGRLLAEPLASEVRQDLERLGFSPIELDPTGYVARPGS